jgi:hypothetical protein
MPELFRGRALSLHACNDQGMIVAADLIDGDNLGAALDRSLANQTPPNAHMHYFKFGCYAARADRI